MKNFKSRENSNFLFILNAWNEKHWMKPELIEQPELMQVKLTLYFENAPINDPVNDPIKLTEYYKCPKILLNLRFF